MFMNEQLLMGSNQTQKPTAAAYENVMSGKMARLCGWLAAIIFIVAVSMCLTLVSGDRDAFAAAEGSHIQITVEIEKGDTLWSIAGQHVHKGQDIRDYIYEIKRLNGLKSSVLQEGDVLRLP